MVFRQLWGSALRCSFRFVTTLTCYGRAYESSKLYRDLKLRGSILKDGDLVLLPQEQIYTKAILWLCPKWKVTNFFLVDQRSMELVFWPRKSWYILYDERTPSLACKSRCQLQRFSSIHANRKYRTTTRQTTGTQSVAALVLLRYDKSPNVISALS